jgi:uncharacterized membrane protein
METPSPSVPIRAVPAGRGSDWIAEGFEMFRQKPGAWIGVILTWGVLSTVIGMIPGINLIGSFLSPIFTAGLMLGCASQARGEGFRLEHLFAGFRSGRLGQLLMLTVWTILFGLVLIILGCIAVGVSMLGKLQGLDFDTPLADQVPSLMQSLDVMSILLFALVALALGVVLAMAVWFAPALVVMRGVSAFEAMKLSVRGCTRNMWAFTVYGLLALVVLILAAIPLLLGLLVAIPVLVASVYTSYRDIYPEPAG